MNCTHCGSPLPAGVASCPICGAPIQNQHPQQGQAAQASFTQQSYKPGVSAGQTAQSQTSFIDQMAKPAISAGKTQIRISDLLFYILVAVFALCAFIPFFSYGSTTYTSSYNYYRAGEGELVVTLLVAACAMIVYRKHRLAVVTVALGLVHVVFDLISNSSNGGTDITRQFAAGPIVLIIILILLLALQVINILAEKKAEALQTTVPQAAGYATPLPETPAMNTPVPTEATPVPGENRASSQDKARCAQCNALLEPGAKFCTSCGASVNRQ
ncbi:zinc ribbon domain-containing protein [Parascardovia denticolens]|uniref:zinc ribbon domain-containing protein n=1 Tax=Parascardovia denticolens TaxID=78258 RepID=UPI00248E0F87|nr:zinc ribbon domain-containing protein [Parascardovia denticolens]